MKQNEKAARQSGLNQFDYLTGNQNGLSVLNCKTKHAVKQRFCPCGAEISRDSIIFNNVKLCADCDKAQAVLESQIFAVTRTPRKALKAFFCVTCQKHFAPLRMSHFSNTCKGCVKSAQAKPDREKRRFMTLALSNMHKSLRGLLAL